MAVNLEIFSSTSCKIHVLFKWNIFFADVHWVVHRLIFENKIKIRHVYFKVARKTVKIPHDRFNPQFKYKNFM